MAQQKGILPIDGTIGNITFYKSRDGFMVREKGGVSANKIKNDPAFQRTRENMAEFGRAGKGGKLIRTSLRSLLQNVSDGRMIARLVKEMMRVIKADATSDRGARNVIDGEAALLEGFDFNVNSKLSTTLFAPYSSVVNRVTGELSISIPSFVPANMIVAPGGATHFKIVTAGAAINFELETFEATINASNVLPWDATDTIALNLVNNVGAASTHPLFLALGIEFFQEVNGKMYSLKNGAFNALCLVKVSGE